MLKKVRFDNCGPLRDATLPLEPFTLLIGPNGSGKTTALKCIGDHGYTPGVSFDQTGATARGESAARFCWAGRWPGIVTTKRWLSGRQEFEHLPAESPDAPALQRLLKQARYVDFHASRLAGAAIVTDLLQLLPDGSNLGATLDRLRDVHPERYESLCSDLARCVPEFDRVLLDVPEPGKKSVMLRTARGSNAVPADRLAQGVLLAVALLTLSWLPDPPPIVCLEEPDRGIHPRLLRGVKTALWRLVRPDDYDDHREPVQVIASTHNPYFLRLFRDEPECVVIADKRGEDVTFQRLIDVPGLDQILEDSALGEAWHAGVL